MGIKFLSFHTIPWCFHVMGNHIACIHQLPPHPAPARTIKLIKSDGHVKIYDRPIAASELMLQFPKHLICHSDSFFIGQKIPALSATDQLKLGHKYFLLPTHFFQSVLSFVTIASIASSSSPAQFTIEQNPMSSKLCISDTQDYSKQWGFEKLVFRESRTGIRRDRKYAIQAKNAYATGVHMSENVIGKTLHKTETKIRYYHYHNSISVTGEPCRVFIPKPAQNNVTWFEKLPYVYDGNMKAIAETVMRFEQQTIGDVHV